MSRNDKSPKSLPKVQGVALGKVIATRHLASAIHPKAKIVVEIGAPRRPRGREDYFCPYRIRGIGGEVTRAAYGVDAVQALQLVMRAIGAELAGHADLRFFEDEDLGFPHPENLLVRGEAKKGKGPSSGA